MKHKYLPFVPIAISAILSFALVDNKTDIDIDGAFTVKNLKETAKNYARPLAYELGVLSPAETTPPKRSDFIDRDRFFSKSINEFGEVKMDEVFDDSLRDYFVRGDGLLVEGESDRIVSKFNGDSTERKIVFNKNASDFPMGLVRLLSSLVKHGSLDNANTYDESVSALGSRSLSMTCNVVSDLAKHMLANIGVHSRIVTTLTLQEWNSYDNGHTFLEVQLPSSHKWVAVDLDANIYFSTPDSEYASVLDLVESDISDIRFNDLAKISTIDYSSFAKYQVISDFASINKAGWYARVLQAIAIKEDTSGKYVFAVSSKKSADRIKSYSPEYEALSVHRFEALFY